MSKKTPPAEWLVSEEKSPTGETIRYVWRAYTEADDSVPSEVVPEITKVDRFGQVWHLDLLSSPYVSYRVAAKLLDVSVAVIYTWEGKRFKPYRKGRAKMISQRDLKELAFEKGITYRRARRKK